MARQHQPDFVGLTGTPGPTGAAQKAAGVSVAIPDKPDKNGNYTVGHAASVLAYTPDGLQHLSYPYPKTQADWVHDIPRILSVKAWQQEPMIEPDRRRVELLHTQHVLPADQEDATWTSSFRPTTTLKTH